MFTSIRNRTAIVTGGSKGIGKGIAQLFASKGARIMIAARGAKDAAQTVEEIEAAGGQAAYTACDVSDPEQVQDLVAKTSERFGGVDILLTRQLNTPNF